MDIQINGAYGFDFSVYEGDEEAYRQGLKTVAEKIVETGVTSYVPTHRMERTTIHCPCIAALFRLLSYVSQVVLVVLGLTQFVHPQTQEKSLYPTILNLLRPLQTPNSATLLGWHAEGPFIQLAKRGAHTPEFLLPASSGFKTFEEIYGAENLVETEDWLMARDGTEDAVGVRIITAAPEVEGVKRGVEEAVKRGIVFSIGHRYAIVIAETVLLY